MRQEKSWDFPKKESFVHNNLHSSVPEHVPRHDRESQPCIFIDIPISCFEFPDFDVIGLFFLDVEFVRSTFEEWFIVVDIFDLDGDCHF